MKTTAVLITILLLCAVSVPAQQDDSATTIASLETAVSSGTATRDQQFELTRLYIRNGRDYEATKLTDRMLAADPNDAGARSLHDQASRNLRAVADRKVAEAQARVYGGHATDADHLTLANAYFDAGSYGAAAETYAHLPASLMDRDTRLRYARSLAWSDQLDRAERVYAALLKEQSAPDVQLEYGRVLSWMGASRPAIDTLNDVYVNDPSEESVMALANAKAWNGDREGAIRLLDAYAQEHAEAAQARKLAADLRQSPDLQIERVSRLIDMQPYNLALRVERARLLAEAGRDAEALKDAQFVREHSSRSIAALDAIERAARAHREREIARLDAQRKSLDAQASMASASGSGGSMLSLARSYTALEAYPQAIALYRRHLQLHPNDTNARIQYARVLSWNRDWNQAEEQYRTLLEQHPDRADLRYEYAQVLSWDSEYGPAVHVFRSLTDLSANPRANLYGDVPAKAYYNLGQIYRWNGWNDAALAAQHEALTLDPGFMPARNELDLVRRARPASTAQARVSYFTDSNDFTMKRADLTAEHWTSARTAFDLGVGRHEFSYAGSNVYANELTAGAAYRYDDHWTLRANAGANFYNEGLGTRPFGGIGAVFRPSLQMRAAFDFNHYDLVYDVFTLQSLALPTGNPGFFAGSPISINDFRAHGDYTPANRWSLLGDATYGFISDSNHRWGAHGLVSYQILDRPFLAVKGEGRVLSYDFRTNRYWSPGDYKSLAGVVAVGQNLRNGFHWDVEAKAGKAWESNFSSDLRSYGANIAVPITPRFDLVANYGYGKSGRLQGLIGTGPEEFLNYWQRHWFVGLRVNRLFSRNEPARNPYFYDHRVLTESPVIPPETH